MAFMDFHDPLFKLEEVNGIATATQPMLQKVAPLNPARIYLSVRRIGMIIGGTPCAVSIAANSNCLTQVQDASGTNTIR